MFLHGQFDDKIQEIPRVAGHKTIRKHVETER